MQYMIDDLLEKEIMETWREGPRIGKNGQFGCQEPAVWQNIEEEEDLAALDKQYADNNAKGT